MRQKIAVVDYGMGNLHSVIKAFNYIAPDDQIEVAAEPAVLNNAESVPRSRSHKRLDIIGGGLTEINITSPTGLVELGKESEENPALFLLSLVEKL